MFLESVFFSVVPVAEAMNAPFATKELFRVQHGRVGFAFQLHEALLIS